MNRLLLATLMATLALAMSLPAMADRPRHGGYQPQVQHHYYQDRRADRGRHHYQKRHKAAKRSKHRHRTPSRVVEHHYYSSPPRYREPRRDSRRYHRRSTDIPLVTVGGYPAVRIQVNH
ncbi:Ni/Co efflux regulator RcnB [Halomonas campaniensis]|uniref:Ni/Co efflux regulator RcnB n=1 Tax=Halomonas campaniensis TaxID=213554 RepID=A0A7W5K5L8_9GAMM|nr:hypothetical protein [Halomonas campaniensis]MBB3332349.1 Ni/Co efflux regulator RcnB [Halomonas campaniensis]